MNWHVIGKRLDYRSGIDQSHFLVYSLLVMIGARGHQWILAFTPMFIEKKWLEWYYPLQRSTLKFLKVSCSLENLLRTTTKAQKTSEIFSFFKGTIKDHTQGSTTLHFLRRIFTTRGYLRQGKDIHSKNEKQFEDILQEKLLLNLDIYHPYINSQGYSLVHWSYFQWNEHSPYFEYSLSRYRVLLAFSPGFKMHEGNTNSKVFIDNQDMEVETICPTANNQIFTKVNFFPLAINS